MWLQLHFKLWLVTFYSYILQLWLQLQLTDTVTAYIAFCDKCL